MDQLFAQLLMNLLSFMMLLLVISLTAGTVFLIVSIIIVLKKVRKRELVSLDLITLEVRLQKDNEIKIDAAEQLFASLSVLKVPGKWSLTAIEEVVSVEVIAKEGVILFTLSVPPNLRDLVEKQIYAYYSSAEISVIEEPTIFSEEGFVVFESLRLKDPQFHPLKTYKELATDSMSALTSPLSKMSEGEGAVIQILIRKASDSWKKAGKAYLASTKKNEASADKATFKVDQKTLEKIDEKTNRTGFEVSIRLVVCAKTKDAADIHMRNIKSSFSQLSSELNSFESVRTGPRQLFMMGFIYKMFPIFNFSFWKSTSVVTADELATLYHFPNKTVETPNINWLKAKTAPVPTEVPQEGGTMMGYGQYRGVRRPIHILPEDRRRHVYIIGKTGTGKSVLLEDMALQDIKAGHGVCVIDPHGDLIDHIVERIPPERAEDVIYFDPADTERPMGLNLLEARTEDEKHFMTSAIINLMYKLYDPQRTGIIGPRFEHAVRNAMLTVMIDDNSSFVELVRILTDNEYAKEFLPKVTDPIVRRYWTDEIANTDKFHKSEILGYIVSKFGRFVTNRLMRNIIGQSKSAFSFRDVMDDQKILLINLSKGRLGEENSQFLGLVIVPKILMAAMSRQEIPEEDRKDFFLYVDEFQNFATPDFAVIMSEARKYRLNLTVANQFISQMDEEIKNAVFGNVGTMISFRVGETDAAYLARLFQPTFSEPDLINVALYHTYMKTIVHNDPVAAFSVDMTKDYAEYKAAANPKIAEIIKNISRLKYGRSREIIEAEISQRSNL